jgi:hypothetical protein
MEWEYKIEMIHIYSAGADPIVRRMNELGSEGWEITATIVKSGDTAGMIFKRQKPNPPLPKPGARAA